MKHLLVWGSIPVLLGVAWWVVNPGVFTIQPIGSLPAGVTMIYYGRGPQMPIFASADGLCLQRQGFVSLLCRGAVLSGMAPIVDRIMIRLPYSRTAYQLSTNGQEFLE